MMIYKVKLNGKIYEVEVNETDAVIRDVEDAPLAALAPVAAAPAAPTAPAVSATPAAAAPAAGIEVRSPMPGNILETKVNVGDSVKRGQVMFVLEAMKMENDVVAPEDGVVKQILAEKGSTVDTDALLAVI